jgi:hypothetical protein
MSTKYSVILSSEERLWLEDITHKGKRNASKVL